MNLNLIPVVVKMAQLTLLFVESGTANSISTLARQPKPTFGRSRSYSYQPKSSDRIPLRKLLFYEIQIFWPDFDAIPV